MNNGDDDSGPIGRVRRDVAQLRSDQAVLRSDHETLRVRFESDHKTLNGINPTLARIDERVNWIAEAVKGQTATDREQSREIATVKASDDKRSGTLGVLGTIAAMFGAALLGLLGSMLADAIKVKPDYHGPAQIEDGYHQRPGAMQPGR